MAAVYLKGAFSSEARPRPSGLVLCLPRARRPMTWASRWADSILDAAEIELARLTPSFPLSRLFRPSTARLRIASRPQQVQSKNIILAFQVILPSSYVSFSALRSVCSSTRHACSVGPIAISSNIHHRCFPKHMRTFTCNPAGPVRAASCRLCHPRCPNM